MVDETRIGLNRHRTSGLDVEHEIRLELDGAIGRLIDNRVINIGRLFGNEVGIQSNGTEIINIRPRLANGTSDIGTHEAGGLILEITILNKGFIKSENLVFLGILGENLAFIDRHLPDIGKFGIVSVEPAAAGPNLVKPLAISMLDTNTGESLNIAKFLKRLDES